MIKLALWCALRDISEVNKTLKDVWPSTGLVYCIYILGSYGLLTEFCRLQNSLCVQVLRSPILAALLHGTRTAAVSHTLWRGTRNGITELSQTAPPIVGHHAGHRHADAVKRHAVMYTRLIHRYTSVAVTYIERTATRCDARRPVVLSLVYNGLYFNMEPRLK